MKKMAKIDLIRTLEEELNYKRFIHTLAVAGTASSLAMCYGADVKKAELAGLLHDCAKCMDIRKMNRLCEKAGLEVTSFEKNSGSLLHSKAGSALAAEKYGVSDPDILNATRKKRVAAGCGMQVEDVNRLLAQYKQMHSEYKNYCADYERQVESLGAKAMELLHSIGMGVDNCNRGKTGFYSFF